MSSLTELNGFTINVNGVFGKEHIEPFDYSDGAAVEQQLHDVLSTSEDLASDSTELEAHISDWPTEYHLSSSRANLLRSLDLTGVNRVLELGCGCGSISRYLGEQEHLQIDAVEGSSNRAALAALRCRDLKNVTISCANFNELDYPENHYDLVLFVGVTEYAGRFSNKDSDQEALQDLLALAKTACTEQGTVLVAIENRTGLKYLYGAAEDHYGVPYVGIENYPNSTGIRTYSKLEWQDQIAKSGFSQSEFMYPFPDYKIPSCVINHRALTDPKLTKDLQKVFANIRSRDYLQAFDFDDKEAMLWRGAYEAGCFADLANSFLILLSNSSQSINKIADFSIREYSNRDFSTQYESHSNAMIFDESPNTKLLAQNEELRNQLNLVTQSRGWQWLQRIRNLKIPGLRPRR